LTRAPCALLRCSCRQRPNDVTIVPPNDVTVESIVWDSIFPWTGCAPQNYVAMPNNGSGRAHGATCGINYPPDMPPSPPISYVDPGESSGEPAKDGSVATGVSKPTETAKGISCEESQQECLSLPGICDEAAAPRCCWQSYFEQTGQCCDAATHASADGRTCVAFRRRLTAAPRPPPTSPLPPQSPPEPPPPPPPSLCSCETYKVSCMCDVSDYVRASSCVGPHTLCPLPLFPARSSNAPP